MPLPRVGEVVVRAVPDALGPLCWTELDAPPLIVGLLLPAPAEPDALPLTDGDVLGVAV